VEIRFANTAKVSLHSAINFIHQDNPTAAANFLKRVEKTLRRLEKYPDSGRRIPEYPELPYRLQKTQKNTECSLLSADKSSSTPVFRRLFSLPYILPITVYRPRWQLELKSVSSTKAVSTATSWSAYQSRCLRTMSARFLSRRYKSLLKPFASR